jgi:hypothetical protein
MLRPIAIAAFLLASGAAAASAEEEDKFNRQGFVISGDACGASRYAHLVGSEYATLYHAALPANANVVNRTMLRTLEYTPYRLNVVLDLSGKISAVGCF